MAGIGIVARNYEGALVFAAGKRIEHWDATQAEIMAALTIDWMHEVDGIIIEGDCLNAIKWLQKMFDRRNKVIFIHIPQDRNQPAYYYSRLALLNSLILHDVNNCNFPQLYCLFEGRYSVQKGYKPSQFCLAVPLAKEHTSWDSLRPPVGLKLYANGLQTLIILPRRASGEGTHFVGPVNATGGLQALYKRATKPSQFCFAAPWAKEHTSWDSLRTPAGPKLYANGLQTLAILPRRTSSKGTHFVGPEKESVCPKVRQHGNRQNISFSSVKTGYKPSQFWLASPQAKEHTSWDPLEPPAGPKICANRLQTLAILPYCAWGEGTHFVGPVKATDGTQGAHCANRQQFCLAAPRAKEHTSWDPIRPPAGPKLYANGLYVNGLQTLTILPRRPRAKEHTSWDPLRPLACPKLCANELQTVLCTNELQTLEIYVTAPLEKEHTLWDPLRRPTGPKRTVVPSNLPAKATSSFGREPLHSSFSGRELISSFSGREPIHSSFSGREPMSFFTTPRSVQTGYKPSQFWLASPQAKEHTSWDPLEPPAGPKICANRLQTLAILPYRAWGEGTHFVGPVKATGGTQGAIMLRLRPYQHQCNRSHKNSAVKRAWARVVLGCPVKIGYESSLFCLAAPRAKEHTSWGPLRPLADPEIYANRLQTLKILPYRACGERINFVGPVKATGGGGPKHCANRQQFCLAARRAKEHTSWDPIRPPAGPKLYVNGLQTLAILPRRPQAKEHTLCDPLRPLACPKLCANELQTVLCTNELQTLEILRHRASGEGTHFVGPRRPTGPKVRKHVNTYNFSPKLCANRLQSLVILPRRAIGKGTHFMGPVKY
ncbi:hypothetical protein M5K25_003834 [Dendrobium thyrsiflorum]|uniref:RNase H type-1 domain-containing protein n=1 Tax=Dendrobium thyrsiflorum TaxID=117978 RepID=A0ABD0VRY2_DENTH